MYYPFINLKSCQTKEDDGRMFAPIVLFTSGYDAFQRGVLHRSLLRLAPACPALNETLVY